jgi:anti-anti-sigma factor
LTALAQTELCPSRSVAKSAGSRLFLRTEWHSKTVVRISATGEVDASNIDRLERYVFRYGANSRRLILDLTDVEFFGVECFSALNLIAERCTTAAVAWTLVPSPAVARILDICDPHRALLSHGLIAKQQRKT